MQRSEQTVSRRRMLQWFAGGFAMLPVADLLAREAGGSAIGAGGGPHFAPRVRNVIFLFMSGGPSQVDLFDRKPLLNKHAGEALPFQKPSLMRTQTQGLLGTPFKFRRYGESGVEVSELLPNIARCADDLCVIRSMVADNINHNGACLQMNTGEQAFSRPSLGSWLLYGLGTENENLPGFVVISPQQPAQGAPLWSSAFMPAAYQGTLVSDLNNPIANVSNARFDRSEQRLQLEAMAALDGQYRARREDDSRLSARIASFELGFRMQSAAPEAFDVDREPEHMQSYYGMDEPETAHFGRQCLMARRLVERGVRFVQVYHTQTNHRTSCQLWDQHDNLTPELRNNCRATDKPVAALIRDLKQRGLLDQTLVIWGGEFGRTPTAETADGREHHPFGFTMFLAGGGVRGGLTYGSTDDFGWHAVENRVHVHDLHATILHLLGLDHTRLTYRYAGRDYRLTDVHGHVVHSLLA